MGKYVDWEKEVREHYKNDTPYCNSCHFEIWDETIEQCPKCNAGKPFLYLDEIWGINGTK